MAKNTETNTNKADDDKKKALDAAIAQIEKDFGKGSIMKLGDKSSTMNVEAVPTGCLSLDLALGIGGIPKGRIVEVYGPESSGKTTIALHMVAEVQKRGGIAGFIDAEHALDPVYASNIGVDIDNLYISQPDSGEQALEIADTMVRSGALRKLTSVVSKTGCIVVFINQLREKIGVMFGNPETTTGGRALKFYSSVRLDVRRVESIKQGGEVVGNHTRIKVVKNKVSPPFKEAEFDIMFGKGVSRSGDVLDIAVDDDIVQKSGAWFSYKGEKIGQGRENTKKYLEDNPEVFDEIEHLVRVRHGLEEGESIEGENDTPEKENKDGSGETED